MKELILILLMMLGSEACNFNDSSNDDDCISAAALMSRVAEENKRLKKELVCKLAEHIKLGTLDTKIIQFLILNLDPEQLIKLNELLEDNKE